MGGCNPADVKFSYSRAILLAENRLFHAPRQACGRDQGATSADGRRHLLNAFHHESGLAVARRPPERLRGETRSTGVPQAMASIATSELVSSAVLVSSSARACRSNSSFLLAQWRIRRIAHGVPRADADEFRARNSPGDSGRDRPVPRSPAARRLLCGAAIARCGAFSSQMRPSHSR